MGDILDGIAAPSLTAPDASVLQPPAEDLFAPRKRAAWHEGERATEARCDFSDRVRLVPRAGLWFIAPWQKSLYGRTLSDIKGDDGMVSRFAEAVAPLIVGILGSYLAQGGWGVVTTPKRRHTERNFATLIAADIADRLGLPFYEDVAVCANRHRVDAVFTLNNLPPEPNLIVFDDFVTTGQTLRSMANLLKRHSKNMVFFAGINNNL